MQFIRTLEGIDEYTLSNGMKVLLFKDDSQSTVTINLTYLVGSRHEGLGEAGMAHLLEHMLFKGTPSFPDAKSALQDKGAFFNATTWFDRTNYFETLTANDDNLEFALKFEADRMLNAWIRKEDLDAEMTVVRNEFEMGENDPTHVLHDQMMSSAFRWHNYGKTTIGNRSDIERVPVEKLRRFYERFYQPDNAVLIVAGKFDEAKAKAFVETYYGTLKRPNRVLSDTYTQEPAQDGPRSVTLLRSGEVATAAIGYHIPAGSDPEYAAVRVLADILSSEPSGLLYKALVEEGIASDVFGMTYALYEPGMMLFFARSKKIEDAQKLHDLLIAKTERESATALTEENLERSRARLLKAYKLNMANSKNLALRLSESIAQGGYELYFLGRDWVKSVKLEDVKKAAQKYLIESNRTSGIFIPTSSPVRATVPDRKPLADLLKSYTGSEGIAKGDDFDATAHNIEAHTKRVQLTPHIQAAFLSKATRGELVQANFIFHFGNEAALKGHTEAMALIPSMLMRGTQHHSFQALQDKLDVLQSTVNIKPRLGGIQVAITSDKTHLHDVVRLTAEMLKQPAFLDSEFLILQQKELADLEEAQSDPQQVGFLELERLKHPWPKESIHYVPSLAETADEIKQLTATRLKQLHKQFYGANQVELSVVGDFDPAALGALIVSEFSDFRSETPYERVNRPFLAALAQDKIVATKDKQMAIVAMGGNIALRDDDESYPAVRFAAFILGESMKSRLMLRLREKEGLSYGAGSSLETSRHTQNASLTLYAMAATQNAPKAMSLLKEEYQKWLQEGVTLDELSDGKAGFKSRFDNLLSNDAFVCQTLASNLELGRTLMFQQQLIDRVQDLKVEEIHAALSAHFSGTQMAQVQSGDF